jgi:glutathione synthase/RimK-type ligase-like ATP-grasp enzyme
LVKRELARIFIRPPTRASEGAQTLNQALGKLSKLSRLDPVPRQYRLVVNWGNPSDFEVHGQGPLVLNKPAAIRNAIDKIASFQKLQESGVRVPEFTTTKPAAVNSLWFARTNLRGSGGDGIVAIRQGDTVPTAPLYVKYIPKVKEYRLHVTKGRVIFAQEKKRKSNNDQTADQKLIRNHANGWVFCPVDLVGISEEIKNAAVASCVALGLDFGAVDMVIGKRDNLPYILEVNTAPGLASPGLISAYATAFKEYLNG